MGLKIIALSPTVTAPLRHSMDFVHNWSVFAWSIFTIKYKKNSRFSKKLLNSINRFSLQNTNKTLVLYQNALQALKHVLPLTRVLQRNCERDRIKHILGFDTK